MTRPRIKPEDVRQAQEWAREDYEAAQRAADTLERLDHNLDDLRTDDEED